MVLLFTAQPGVGLCEGDFPGRGVIQGLAGIGVLVSKNQRNLERDGGDGRAEKLWGKRRGKNG